MALLGDLHIYFSITLRPCYWTFQPYKCHETFLLFFFPEGNWRWEYWAQGGGGVQREVTYSLDIDLKKKYNFFSIYLDVSLSCVPLYRYWQISIILLFIYSDVYQVKPRCRTTGMSWSKYHGYDTISKYVLSNFISIKYLHSLSIMIGFLHSNSDVFFTVQVYWLSGGELQWH